MNESTPETEQPDEPKRKPAANRASNLLRPRGVVPKVGENAARRAEIPRRGSETQRTPEGGRALTVGPEIALAGNISACDRLVVEGCVETDLTGAKAVEVMPGGTFKGSAVVETATIAGIFEGDLTGRRRVVVKAGGRVIGNVNYGTVVIEEGGVVIGSLNIIGDGN